MKFTDKLACFFSLLQCRILKKSIPLAVRWQLTNRCTLRCRYCNLWTSPAEELTTKQIFSVLGELARLGTKRISFSGGDVLLRDDISEIIDCCRDKDIYPEMNSNGVLVPKRMDVVKKLDFLKLSLDGSEKTHDFLRGKGAYANVMRSAGACFDNKVKFGFATTLTKYNIDDVDFVLEVAKKYNSVVAFQPIKKLYRGIDDIGDFMIEKGKFRKTIDKLIREKLAGNKNIRNSLPGLRHIYNWPDYGKLKCWAGKIFCIIDVDGSVFPCDRITYEKELSNCAKEGFRRVLATLPQVHCEGCGFCGSLELNYLMSFKFQILPSLTKILT